MSQRILEGVYAERKHYTESVSKDEKRAERKAEDERIKRLTREMVKTESGKIIKNPDGSFEF